MYRAVQLSRLYEQIVEQIEASVLSGGLKPGEQLPPERELAQRFGVSRTAVREAINALREKGLVEAFPGRGTFVTTGNVAAQRVRQSIIQGSRLTQPGSLGSLAEVRELLEPEIAARAAANAGEKDLAAMREAMAAMDAALDDPDGYIEADLDFHLALAEATDNPVFLTLIDSIVGLLREQRRRIFLAGGPERGQFHHRRVLDAIERRDPEAARVAMRDHMTQVREFSGAGAGAQREVHAR
jgi:GntR family transcriptional repressor for pyruvate dehydrogenase complex